MGRHYTTQDMNEICGIMKDGGCNVGGNGGFIEGIY